MARRCKKRRVCSLPRCQSFAPDSADKGEPPIIMTVDEYECVRLIDFAGLTQAECAAQMCVARTTVQSIYDSARHKLACSLVEGKWLSISGGAYDLCDGRTDCCPNHRHCRNWNAGRDSLVMDVGRNVAMKKVAVTYDNGQIFQHFGHTEAFKLYDIEEGKIVREEVVSTYGSGHGALADFLKGWQVDTLICGGIGAGAQHALAAAGIALYGGVAGDADGAVQALVSWNLNYQAGATCDHHGHHGHHGHACGHHGHGCGGHGEA